MYDRWNLVPTFDDGEDTPSVSKAEFEEDNLDNVVQHLDSFLKGAGFVYDGALVIDTCAGCNSCEASDYE